MATFYIDPTYTGSVSDGSIENPYKTWDDFGNFESNNSYLMKKGTEITLTKTIQVRGHDGQIATNVYLGAYGEGERPIINSVPGTESDIISMTICDGVTVEGFRLIGEIRWGEGVTTACVSPSGYWSAGTPENPTPWCKNVVVKDCVMSGAFNCVRILNYATGVDGVKIENCEIFNSTDDGFFIANVENIEIAGCKVHKVNQAYLNGHEDAGGDGIQFAGTVPGVYVHDCHVDRSDTANKFCLIWADQHPDRPYGCRIENNYFISPQPQGGGAGIYISGGKGVEVIGNTFTHADEEGGLGAMYCHTPEMKIHSNVFIDTPSAMALFTPGGFYSSEVYNNTFYMTGDGPIYSATGVICPTGSPVIGKNNIFKLAPGTVPWYDNVSGNEFSNNCYTESCPQAGTSDVIGDPLFVDETSNNFQLSELSPCRNVGADVGITHDKAGNPIQGTPDIGAYEYQDGSPTLPTCSPLTEPLNNASGTELTATLKWNPVYNATGYKLNFNGAVIDVGNVTEYYATGLTYDTTYTWSITPYNTVGDAVGCPTWSFTTKSENVPNDYIDLKWALQPDADGYKISLGTDNPPTNVEDGLDVGNVDTYRFENPEFLTTYYWQIVPYNEGGDATGCPIWTFITEDDGTILPPNPTEAVYPPDGAVDVPITTA